MATASTKKTTLIETKTTVLPVHFVDTLHTRDESDLDKVFRLLQINVGNGVNEQAFSNFDARAPVHIENLVAAKPNIVVMQEMRRFDAPAENVLKPIPEAKTKPRDFLLQCCNALGFEYEYAKRNPGALAFGQATLYDPKRFFPKQVVKKWLSTSPSDVSSETSLAPKPINVENTAARQQPGWGSMALGVEFNYVKSERIVMVGDRVPSFWVWNVHFPLSAQSKMDCTDALLEMFKKECGEDAPIIVSGDMNTFFDQTPVKHKHLPSSAHEQLHAFADAGFINATTSIRDLSGNVNTGTFLGFDSDAMKQRPEKLGHLDHIMFHRNHFTLKSPFATIWATKEQLETRNTPSDHIAVVVDLSSIQ